MYSEELKTARERASKANKTAMDYAAEMKAKPEQAKEIEEKFNKAFEDFRVAQSDFQSLEARETKAAEIEASYEQFHKPAAEKHMRTLGLDPTDKDFQRFHRETFRLYVSKGEAFAAAKLATAPKETHALLGSENDLGGFLAPEDLRSEIIKDLPGFSVFRTAGARVVPTSRNSVVFPSIQPNTGSAPEPNMRTSNVAGTWRNEGAQGTDGSAPAVQSQPKFGQERIDIHTWQPAAVVVTAEFIEDAATNVEELLGELFAETKGMDEDYQFLNGTGVNGPEGVLQASIATVPTGVTTVLSYGGILDLWAGLPAQYRNGASFMMNSKTFAAILKLETTGGMILFPPNALPGTLLGKQVYFDEYLPDVGASALPIVFGAFRYYVIAERAEMRIQRLVERFAPAIGLLPTARLGGKVVRKNAFRVQRVAVS
jgi:HK97 family phage major capsid protein